MEPKTLWSSGQDHLLRLSRAWVGDEGASGSKRGHVSTSKSFPSLSCVTLVMVPLAKAIPWPSPESAGEDTSPEGKMEA